MVRFILRSELLVSNSVCVASLNYWKGTKLPFGHGLHHMLRLVITIGSLATFCIFLISCPSGASVFDDVIGSDHMISWCSEGSDLRAAFACSRGILLFNHRPSWTRMVHQLAASLINPQITSRRILELSARRGPAPCIAYYQLMMASQHCHVRTFRIMLPDLVCLTSSQSRRRAIEVFQTCIIS
jgi:hypothetical protein